MEKILNTLKKDIQKFAETISQIIQIDVEIMDKNFIRIAGTGRLKNKIGRSMTEESHIYKKVLETGKEYVILNPKESIHCSKCPSIENCKEKLEVSTPIFLNNEVVGVIGLICFNNQQKLNFIDKQEKYLTFLKQISGFISSQAYLFLESSSAESKKEFLKVILNKIEEGILIYDNNYQLTHMNEVAIKLFNTKILQESLFIQPLNDNFLGKNAYSIIYNDKKLDVFGEIFKKNTEIQQREKNKLPKF